jgi:uncharacterized protein YprB with RNaseH-like and TPR domain
VLDLETLGLRGEPLFLIGLLCFDPDGTPVCRQLLARSLEEEASIIAVCAELLGRMQLLVTFNGEKFDLPTLRARAARHGLGIPTPPRHEDMIHEARSRFGSTVRNCRLKTLERAVCGRSRRGDIPGREIPRVYEEFTRTGDASRLAAVARHNLLDLATTAELLTRLWP